MEYQTQTSKPHSAKKKASLVILLIFLGIWLVLGAGFLGAWIQGQLANGRDLPIESTVDGNIPVSSDEADITDLVKKVSPSVVSIVTTQTARSGYFQQEMGGAGTGIIISENGYILTNKHVVNSANAIQVVSSDGERYKDVSLVGVDPLNDLAFLKINGAKGLPASKLGDSGTVRVGQRVIAIGNSLGQYQNTVTSGIISGLGRPIVAALDESGSTMESLNDLLQTDAAINPGNSGGPLINMSGQVIGINTAIVSKAQSVGFAIPINASKGLIRGILKDGKIAKSYIGIQYIAITPDIQAEYDLSEKQGALVYNPQKDGAAVAKGSPADRAGIQEGDIVTKINDKVVGKQGGLGSLVAEFLPGEEVDLTVIRDGKSHELKIKLGEYKG